MIKGRRLFATLGDQVFDVLKNAILRNQFLPGEELKVEELAAELGVSSTPIREALVRLGDMGLVEIAPNKGAKVALIRPEDIRDLWEVRRLLESYAARVAVPTIPKDEVESLERQLNDVLANPDDFQKYIESDFALHAALYKHLGNRLLKRMLDQVNSQYQRIRYFAESGLPTGQREVVIQVTLEHLAIARAMKTGSAEHTAQEVERHLQNAEMRTLAALDRRMAEASNK